MTVGFPAFWDLIRPRWRVVLIELKISGALPASDLAERLGSSYMAARKSCEDFVKAGYVDRTRHANKVIGRPEILFSLSEKAADLFPQCGPAITTELLELVKHAHGDRAPERLLFQYFQGIKSRLEDVLRKHSSFEKKISALLMAREADGCIWRIDEVSSNRARIIEYHNPMQAVFDQYPRVVQMEQAALGEILGATCSREELPSLKNEQARVVYEFESAGVES